MKNESSGKKNMWERGNVDFATGKEVNNKEFFKNNGDIKDTGVLNDYQNGKTKSSVVIFRR